MIDFPDIGDLRPAPRTTSTVVLWLMLLVVVGGAGVLIWPAARHEAGPAVSMARSQDPAQVAPASTRPSKVVARAVR
jgi:hypothetical protein